ncbi:MAG TPA: GspE/PulE family protein [Terrimicrobiaceae bacterium]
MLISSGKGLLQQLLADVAADAGAPAGIVNGEIEQATRDGRSVVRALLEKEQLAAADFLERLAERLGFPWIDATDLHMPSSAASLLPARLALRHHVVPCAGDSEVLTLACYDPFDHAARAAIRQGLTCDVRFVMAPRAAILARLREQYGVGAETFEALLEGREDAGAEEWKEEVNVLDDEDAEASVMKFVNQIIREALVERATDIHVEPLDGDLRIRYRIDGMLREIPVPPNIRMLQASVLSRIKIMSNLDIAERRIPQDGRISLEFEGKPIDVRVATIPSVTGETISLRLLGQELFDFAKLGLDQQGEAIIRELIAMPNGIVLVTGPTGCGKSTSLYTFLSELNTKDRRIVTIEDPVEHKLPGVIQIAVKPEIDLTFARSLRSVLRGDPNVIMVGEMRDFETAEIAIRAALTGHLVFSTLHTNDSVGGITRLLDMGVEPFLLGSSVRAFIAQRLVRCLCPECKRPDPQSAAYLAENGVRGVREAVINGAHGCGKCRMTGYQGRTAIYEICRVTSAMQELIQHKAPTNALRAKAIEEGMIPLRENGWRRVLRGDTSVEEVLRVTAAAAVLAE